MAFDPRQVRGELLKQQSNVEQQLVQMTRAKFQLEGALAVLDAQLAEETTIPKMKEL